MMKHNYKEENQKSGNVNAIAYLFLRLGVNKSPESILIVIVSFRVINMFLSDSGSPL